MQVGRAASTGGGERLNLYHLLRELLLLKGSHAKNPIKAFIQIA
jgi:hypothetical protein